MTDVGKISLGVEIDASDLSARLGEAVRRAIAPALADIQRELEKTQREYNQTARASDKATAAQTAGARAVADAVQQVGQEQEKTAAKTRTASGVTSRSINAITRAIDKQTAALNANTTARAANAAAPTGGPPDGGGGRSGGGGGSSGGGRRVDAHRGGFMQGGRGRFGFLTSPVGLNLGALGIGSIPAAATAITQLTASIQQLAGAGLAVPGIMAGIGVSFGTAKLGFVGMKDAVKALNDAAKSGDPKDLEKATEAMKDMDPAAQAVAKTVSSLTRGPLLDLQKMTAGRMLAGFDRDLQGLADRALPRVSGGIGKVADSWNGTLKQLTGSLGSDSSLTFMDRIFGNTAEGQRRANAAIDPLVHAVGTLTAAGTDVLPRLGDGLTKVAERFDNFISKADADGRLGKWINDGLTGARQLGESFLNIGKVLTGLTNASGTGGFLPWLEKVTGQLATLVNSTEGQAGLKKFFADGKEQMDQWRPILGDLLQILKQVYEASRTWSGIMLPFLAAATGLLVKFPDLLSGLLVGLLAFKTISPFIGLLGQLDRLNTGLGKASTTAGGLKGKLGGLGSTGAILGLGGAIMNANAQSPDQINRAGILGTLGGGALVGAEVGGPVGAAFGLLAGAAVALTETFLAQKRQLDAVTAAHQDFLDHRPPAIPAIPTNAPVVPGAAVQPTNLLGPARPELGGPSLTGLLLGPAAPVGSGSGGELRNLPGIDAALGAINDKAAAAAANADLLAHNISSLPTGEVVLKDNTPEAIKKVQDLGYAVKSLPDGQVQIQVQYMLDGQPISREQLVTPIRVAATPGGTAPTHGGGRAGGGVFPGYAPGLDSIHALVSPGEGVLIPEAVRGIGGAAAVYAINSAFRPGLSRKGYAGGGVVGFADGGIGAAAVGLGPETELSVLVQIRDLLAGKGGAGTPLADTAANTGLMADATKSTAGGGQKMGPFGTPLKPRDLGYDMAAAAISALGGDPEKFIGSDPMAAAVTAASSGSGGVPGAPGALAGTGADFTSVSAALVKFAMSGDTADLAGTGLNANSPVVTAITSARNKKKGGLDDKSIADLTGQIVGGGGFTGVLDPTNTPLIKSLTRFHDQMVKKGGVPGTTTTTTPTSTTTASGLPMTPGLATPMTADAMGLISFAQSASGGAYKWGASDLSAGLSDCSGAVSDVVELITKGQADPGRLFDTHSAGGVLSSLGAVQGAVPGALQIGWSDTHMRATLPNGVAFESGGQTGQGATFGGNAQGAEGMPNIMSLPVTGGAAALGMGGLGAGGAGGSGTPVFVTNWPGGGAGGIGDMLKGVAGAGIDAAGQAGIGVVGDIGSAVTSAIQTPPDQRAPDAALASLVKEGNPEAFAAAMGFNVQDFSRFGGAGPGGVQPGGPGFDASGRLFSDTAGLIDRTFTSLNAQLQAMKDQIVDVTKQVADKLNEDALQPIIKSGLQAGLEDLKSTVSSAIGTSLGEAAGPPIADAVGTAVANLPIDKSGGGGAGSALAAGDPAGVVGALFASGGGVSGGQAGKDSVPALLMPQEWVLNTKDVAAMGGFGGVGSFLGALHSSKGGLRRFATGGGVIGNDTVGAEFFGVSEVPIISTIVNLLVRVLLKVIGVEIEVRDTLNEMTSDFRSFRGDAFKAFDAQGRLLNDTSGLIERSATSEQTAADERIRILKIVIQAIIKYLIEKVIVPIAKAVANAAIQAGASAAGAATNSAAPGAGGIVSSLISSAGSAGVDIAAEVGTDFALAISQTLIDMVASGLQSQFPDLVTGIFGGSGLAALFDPLGGGLGNILGAILGIFTGLIGGGAFGGLGTVIPGDALFGGLLGGSLFDDGGMANGVGFLPKATNSPELILSPTETTIFSRFVNALERGGFGGGNRTVHAPITVIGGRETATQVENRLLKLMP